MPLALVLPVFQSPFGSFMRRNSFEATRSISFPVVPADASARHDEHSTWLSYLQFRVSVPDGSLTGPPNCTCMYGLP